MNSLLHGTKVQQGSKPKSWYQGGSIPMPIAFSRNAFIGQHKVKSISKHGSVCVPGRIPVRLQEQQLRPVRTPLDQSNPCKQQSAAKHLPRLHSRCRRPDQQAAAEDVVARRSSRRERRGSSADPFNPPSTKSNLAEERRAIPMSLQLYPHFAEGGSLPTSIEHVRIWCQIQ